MLIQNLLSRRNYVSYHMLYEGEPSTTVCFFDKQGNLIKEITVDWTTIAETTQPPARFFVYIDVNTYTVIMISDSFHYAGQKLTF